MQLAAGTAVTAVLLGSIPSPPSGDIALGPIRLTAYGFTLAIAALVAVEFARRRAPRRGMKPDDFGAIALWAIPAGLIGARLYHVLTDWDRFEGRWFDVVKVWEGGLGIPGGIAAGVLAGLWIAQRRGLVLLDALDVAAPALPLAQAIGRWGNWWNQELFGRPSVLPWALEISPAHRPAGYEQFVTFHPTFLYESVWNLGLVALLLLLDRRRLRPGRLFCVYLIGYGFGRLWVEALRIDPATRLGPFRVNTWMSLTLIIGGTVACLLLRDRHLRRPDDAGSGRSGVPNGPEAAAGPSGTTSTEGAEVP